MTIVIVIGLPASGKTTYINSISKNNDKYTDDFISNFFNGVLISKIKEIDEIHLKASCHLLDAFEDIENRE